MVLLLVYDNGISAYAILSINYRFVVINFASFRISGCSDLIDENVSSVQSWIGEGQTELYR